jgi:hypothetical protein
MNRWQDTTTYSRSQTFCAIVSFHYLAVLRRYIWLFRLFSTPAAPAEFDKAGTGARHRASARRQARII